MRIVLAFLALLVVFFGMLLINSYYIESFAKKYIYCDIEKLPKKDTALILGTTKYIDKGKVNYFYKYRIDAGVKLFKAKKVNKLLLSGANPSKYYNEPETMRRDLIKRGVPPDKIVLDYAGFRTLDSVVRAKEVFGLRDYIIVSQPFHLKRALFIAYKKGFKAIGFCAEERKGTLAEKRMFLRELLARAKAMLDIFILKTEPKFKK